MKRRLTLAIGCLACAMPSIAAITSPQAARTSQLASDENRRLSFLDATQAAQRELDQRGLSAVHGIASVVFLKGTESGCGHYDVRIEPPATLPDGTRLRGFCVAIDGTMAPAMDFRTFPGATLSTPPGRDSLPQKGLGSEPREG